MLLRLETGIDFPGHGSEFILKVEEMDFHLPILGILDVTDTKNHDTEVIISDLQECMFLEQVIHLCERVQKEYNQQSDLRRWTYSLCLVNIEPTKLSLSAQEDLMTTPAVINAIEEGKFWK